MADAKMRPSNDNVEAFLNKIADETKRQDSFKILEMMKQVSKMEPTLWAGSIIGFGSYHYRYESGHEGDACLIGFSPRKESLSLYVLSGFEGQEQLLEQLGKHKTGKSCLYIKRLNDIDLPTLHKIIDESFKQTKGLYQADTSIKI